MIMKLQYFCCVLSFSHDVCGYVGIVIQMVIHTSYSIDWIINTQSKQQSKSKHEEF